MALVRGLTVHLEAAFLIGVFIQNTVRVQLVDNLQRIIHLGQWGVWEHGADVAGWGGGAVVVGEHGPGDPVVQEGSHLVLVLLRRLLHSPGSWAMGNY